MLNFTIKTPTEVVFGRGIEEKIGERIKEYGAHRVLVHFGGASARSSGLLDRVERSLFDAGLSFVELGGVSPNPKISLVRKGVALCRREGLDFVLAVGGGSVIDSAKAIAMGAATGRDPWEFASTGTRPDKTLPVATVLTLAASGSETSNSCVLTNEETKEKRGITSETNRPVISFLNPENTFTVSKFQTGCGIVDIMMHTLERYLTPEGGESDLTDRIAEGLLIAVRDAGRRAIADPRDYEARATLMWAGSVSHNDYTGCGRKRSRCTSSSMSFPRSATRSPTAPVFPCCSRRGRSTKCRMIIPVSRNLQTACSASRWISNTLSAPRARASARCAASSRRSACRPIFLSSASSRKTMKSSPRTRSAP